MDGALRCAFIKRMKESYLGKSQALLSLVRKEAVIDFGVAMSPMRGIALVGTITISQGSKGVAVAALSPE